MRGSGWRRYAPARMKTVQSCSLRGKKIVGDWNRCAEVKSNARLPPILSACYHPLRSRRQAGHA
jgi:hypothetical protein